MKLKNLLGYIPIIALISLGVYIYLQANKPSADTAICTSGFPDVAISVVDDFIDEVDEELIKVKTIATQDGQVDLLVDGGEIFGPSSMLVEANQEVFWYVRKDLGVEELDIKANVSSICGSTFTIYYPEDEI